MAEKATMGVKLDLDTRERLKALGAVKDRSPHYMMREAIGQYLEREEAKEQERRLTLERWEHYVNTGEAVDHEKVAEWMDSLIADNATSCPVKVD